MIGAMTGGHVINYRRLPPAGPFIWAALILAAGGVLAWYHRGPLRHVDPDAPVRGRLILAVTVVLAGLIVISATAKLWFRHLWHKRKYDR